MRIALPPAIDPTAFAGIDPAAPIVTLDGETMGTTWRVVYVAGPADPLAARAAIEVQLAGLVDEMSHWAPGSLLSRFNRAPAGTWTTLPPDFATVIAAGLELAAITGGAFDPAIGRLVDLWGFGPPGPMLVPDAAGIAAARDRSGWHRLEWASGARRLRQPGGVALDLSGIAKGHAVDAVTGTLTALGMRHMLVEIGGELVGCGVRPDGEPWWVDLETPPGITLPPLRVALHGLAVATSGSYRRGDHSLDPRTGRPATSGVVSCSVIADRAMVADAWATALFVLSVDEGMALADRHGIAARLIVVTGSGLVERLTRPLSALIDG